MSTAPSSGESSEKPNVRLLIPVWGQRYISLFSDLTLMSLLSPGNLPALAEMANLEVVMLTASSDLDLFERAPAFQALRRIAPVKFIPIDDLIVDGLYGVTLTLAYLRGVTELGERMVDTYFLFLNADFVVADGSLRSVGRRIGNGERALLASSIRGTSEDIEPKLRALVNKREGVLSVSPRELVRMALEAMHPTQIAKIVNSDLCHSVEVNQFYWQVDANTLISRHFLLFMLCLRPQRVVNEVYSFCDYSFVPEMCPEANTTAMEDSDDFFFLEMQAGDSERNLLRLGRPSIAEIAHSLSRWTTKQHRDYSLKHTLVFHADDLPAGTSAMCEEADRYIRAVHERLDPQPKPYRNHPYWISGSPPPLVLRLTKHLYRTIFGRVPNVTMLHPDWLDYRRVRQLLRSNTDMEGKNALYVKEGAGLFIEHLGAAQAVSVDAALSGICSAARSLPKRFDFVLVELRTSKLRDVRALLEKLHPLLANGGQLAVFVKAAPGEAVDITNQLVAQIESVAPQELYRVSFYFAGGLLRMLARGLLDRSTRIYARHGWKSAPLVGILVLVAALLSLITNRGQMSIQDARRSVEVCSALTLVLQN